MAWLDLFTKEIIVPGSEPLRWLFVLKAEEQWISKGGYGTNVN